MLVCFRKLEFIIYMGFILYFLVYNVLFVYFCRLGFFSFVINILISMIFFGRLIWLRFFYIILLYRVE